MPDVVLSGKDSKAAVIKMFQQVRASSLEMNRKIENLNKEIKEIKNQMGIWN